MSNTNNSPATADGTNPQSTQKKVISIQGNTIPVQGTTGQINQVSGGQNPDQKITQPQTNNTQPPRQSGGGPEGPAVQGNVTPGTTIGNAPAQAVGTGVQPKEATPQQDDPNNIDIDKFISNSTTDVKVFDEKEQAKLEKMKKLTQAIESINKTRRIVFNNAETGEFVGTKFQYVADENGKTPYDYINDEEVQEHIEFIVPEGDPQDGSPVDAPITFFWKKPTF